MSQARILTSNQAKSVIAFIATSKNAKRNRLIFALSYFGGMRAKEIAALTYDDVLTKDGRIKEVISLTSSMTKGKCGRQVFVNSNLEQYLKTFIKDIRVREGVLLHPQGNKKHFTANSLSIVLNNIYKRSGFEGCSSHSGRRSFATQLSQKGTSIRVIQKLGGWKSIASVMPYLDANDEMLKNAVESLS